MKIRVKAPCWIQYIIDDDKPHNYIIQPGDKGVELSAEKKIKIKIGNPDSVLAVSYNGQPVEFKPKCFPWWVNYPSRPDDNVCP